jgi:hypothetical protein
VICKDFNLRSSSRKVSFPSAEVIHAFGVIFPLSPFPLQMVVRKLTHAPAEDRVRGLPDLFGRERTANVGTN